MGETRLSDAVVKFHPRSETYSTDSPVKFPNDFSAEFDQIGGAVSLGAAGAEFIEAGGEFFGRKLGQAEVAAEFHDGPMVGIAFGHVETAAAACKFQKS